MTELLVHDLILNILKDNGIEDKSYSIVGGGDNRVSYIEVRIISLKKSFRLIFNSLKDMYYCETKIKGFKVSEERINRFKEIVWKTNRF